MGTYRESILQALLRKSLPERYHVATGFVYGSSRQIDILIYDRIDYAPVFREGDLVVATPASVRAVIEVKTNLTKQELQKSINFLQEICLLDNRNPPFFKGVFGFRSDLDKDALLAEVVNCYDSEFQDWEGMDNINIMGNPYEHITCFCVLDKVYGFVEYDRDGSTKNMVPGLYSCESATELNAQAAYFMDLLLAYLQTDQIKRDTSRRIIRELGADTICQKFGNLAPAIWGPYFSRDEIGDPAGVEAVAAAEGEIFAVSEWLSSGSWAKKSDE